MLLPICHAPAIWKGQRGTVYCSLPVRHAPTYTQYPGKYVVFFQAAGSTDSLFTTYFQSYERAALVFNSMITP